MMELLYMILSVAFWRAATEEMRDKNKTAWILLLFLSAWNAATVAAALL